MNPILEINNIYLTICTFLTTKEEKVVHYLNVSKNYNVYSIKLVYIRRHVELDAQWFKS